MAEGRSLFDLSDDDDDTKTVGPTSITASTDQLVSTDRPEDGADGFSDDDSEEFAAAAAEIMQGEEGVALKQSLTSAEMERAEKNRMKALSLKKARLMAKSSSGAFKPHRCDQPKMVDSGGGFFIEEPSDGPVKDGEGSGTGFFMDMPAPILPHEQPACGMCEKKFNDSFLLRVFDHKVCDACRDMGRDGEHELIAKTEAKTTFLLRDTDFDDCDHGKALKYMNKKNPHNPRGGDMKLYLRLQVEERAISVWGSEDALQKELDEREDRKIALKAKKYTKKMKELRMKVRSSLYSKDLSTHTHQYKDEVYHEEEDEYSQTCQTCGHINRYEKM